MKCPTCNKETTNPKYCSRSCAAIANNTGNRRHGKPAGVCIQCGKPKSSSGRKYCSSQCAGDARRKDTTTNASRQARYRAKHGYLRAYAPNANKEVIKEFYRNCPDGYEVDHIIPLSKGGLHHEDNLQYLTVAENRSKGNKMVAPTGLEPVTSPVMSWEL